MKMRAFGDQRARPIETAADIVFCLDATGSMEPCIDALKHQIESFTSRLEELGTIKFRLRVVAYRDLHDPTGPQVPWVETPFTSSLSEFRKWLQPIRAEGGGLHRGAESTLDALYKSIRSEWRPQVHKTVVLMTDDNTHATLHPSTYRGIAPGDDGVTRVVQEMDELANLLMYMITPDYPAYRTFYAAAERAGRRIVWDRISKIEADEEHLGLKSVDWSSLFLRLAEKISTSSQQLAATS